VTTEFRNIRAGARREARSDWVGHLGRLGLAAQGLCFAIVGALAIGLVTGVGGAETDPQGAFHALARTDWTRVLLLALVCGFVAYSIWRFAQAFFDRGGMGGDPSGLGRRAIQLCQGLLYAILATSAVRVLLGARAKSGGGSKRAAAGVLGWPGGPELVGFIAAVILIIAGVMAYWALSRRFEESLTMSEMSRGTERLVRTCGIVGLCSLALVLAIIGWFLLKAAIEFNARDAISIGGALAKLSHRPYGSYLLSIVAAGFIVFGLFDFLQARFHKV
jgi:Domain of Unknown Function (DUF1206)